MSYVVHTICNSIVVGLFHLQGQHIAKKGPMPLAFLQWKCIAAKLKPVTVKKQKITLNPKNKPKHKASSSRPSINDKIINTKIIS